MGIGQTTQQRSEIAQEMEQLRLDIRDLDESDIAAARAIYERTIALQARIDGYAAIQLQRLREVGLLNLADKMERTIMEFT